MSPKWLSSKYTLWRHQCPPGSMPKRESIHNQLFTVNLNHIILNFLFIPVILSWIYYFMKVLVWLTNGGPTELSHVLNGHHWDRNDEFFSLSHSRFTFETWSVPGNITVGFQGGSYSLLDPCAWRPKTKLEGQSTVEELLKIGNRSKNRFFKKHRPWNIFNLNWSS